MPTKETTPTNTSALGDKISALFSSFTTKKEGEHKSTRSIILTRQQSTTALVTCILSVIGVFVYGFMTYQKYAQLNDQSSELINLYSYGIDTTNETLRQYSSDLISIHNLLEASDEVNTTLNNYQKLAEDQAKYYNMFLRHLYLPSINVWKDPYTTLIDPTLMGQKYLESDPFQDIPLIQYWSDFFKNVWEGSENNEVTAINIGVISDIDDEHFIVPVEVSFNAPTKRSFLFLVNKLSTTSDQNNISLLNEFFFYLIKNIKEFKSKEIESLAQTYQNILPLSADKDNSDLIIGYHLYQWIKYHTDNILIDDTIINTTIRENVLCDETRNDNECFYNFREKYRNLPYLAYTIGILNTKDKTQHLETFLKELAPIIAITDFNFTKVGEYDALVKNEYGYQGRVTFNAYGRSMSNEDVAEIAEKL
ncbi:MAG: hypothetical protein LBH96_06325 [Candidatus Peribacteria bacterium]|jgi:hypothetical protein|nr:hypothetical protein [Candidatus Peribacteria bacterium]